MFTGAQTEVLDVAYRRQQAVTAVAFEHTQRGVDISQRKQATAIGIKRQAAHTVQTIEARLPLAHFSNLAQMAVAAIDAEHGDGIVVVTCGIQIVATR